MKIDVWDKDMRVIGDYARKIRVPTPMFDATKPIYVKAMKSGFGAQDTAAVCAVLEKMAKVKRKTRKRSTPLIPAQAGSERQFATTLPRPIRGTNGVTPCAWPVHR